MTHNQMNIGNFFDSVVKKADFIVLDYETTGLVTKIDHLYNSTIPEFDENFENHRASQYSNDWTGQQGAKKTQRFVKNGLRGFLNEFGGQGEIYVKTRWTTDATSNLYPALSGSPLLLGKNKPKSIVSNKYLQNTEKCHFKLKISELMIRIESGWPKNGFRILWRLRS